MKTRNALFAAIAAMAIAGSIAAFAQSTGMELGPNTKIIDRIYAGGNAPTTSTCTMSVGSTNFAGRVTAAGGATSCVITFAASNGQAAAWGARAPVCMVIDETAVRASMTVSVSTTTLTVGALTTADVFSYICVGSM